MRKTKPPTVAVTIRLNPDAVKSLDKLLHRAFVYHVCGRAPTRKSVLEDLAHRALRVES